MEIDAFQIMPNLCTLLLHCPYGQPLRLPKMMVLPKIMALPKMLALPKTMQIIIGQG